MQTIRLIIAGRSGLLHGMLSDLARAQSDIEVVGEAVEPLALMMAVRTLRAHTVVLDADDPALAGLGSHLLSEYPELTILGVAATEVYIEQRCPRRAILSLPPGEILIALRKALRSPCE